jgi:hypothetical protein
MQQCRIPDPTSKELNLIRVAPLICSKGKIYSPVSNYNWFKLFLEQFILYLTKSLKTTTKIYKYTPSSLVKEVILTRFGTNIGNINND